jgi:hypothetical protein
MNLANRSAVFLSAVLLFAALQYLHAKDGVAGSFPHEPAPPRPDIEFDPTPYFEHGYWFHAGMGWSHLRVEGEILGTDVPEWVHGNKGFDVSCHGGGAKLQYFFSAKQRGAFMGARTEITRVSVELRSAGLELRSLRHDLGIDAGYRFPLGRHWYVTPWGGIDYTFDAHDLEIAGRTYKDARFDLFAAVHFGCRF